MDGHTGWANRELLKRAGISADYLKKLTADERSYYGAGKDFTPNGFFTVTLWAMHESSCEVGRCWTLGDHGELKESVA
jgi:hypothetical protein